jgi:hypothetical protein
VRWSYSGFLRSAVEAEAAKVMRRAQELAPRNEGRMIPSIPITLDPSLVERGVIDVPADVDANPIIDAIRKAAEQAVEVPAAPLIVIRAADGAPSIVVGRECSHESEVEVDLIVTGEVVARLCLACGRTAYAEGW